MKWFPIPGKNISEIISGIMPFFILNISTASVWMFLSWTEGISEIYFGLFYYFQRRWFCTLFMQYPSKHLLVSKTSSTRLQRNNFTSSKTSWRPFQDLSQDVLEDEKLLRWSRLQDVFKTYLEDVFKTSRRQIKFLLVISISNKSKCISKKSMFYKSISDKSKANPKRVT